MNRNQTPHLVDDKEIVKVLASRTGMEEALIHTLIHYFERVILHHVMMGDHVRIKDFFTIYWSNQQVEIMLNEKAKRRIKKK